MGDKMLFLWYWELNENVALAERLKAAQELMSSGLFPPEGVNVLRFDITPGNWGVTLLEADNAEDVFKTVSIWRAALPGFFKSVKVSPAIPVKDALPLNGALIKSIDEAKAKA
jgi:hypothetical protein